VSMALGAEATFVARTLDSDRKHLTSVLRAAADHQGTALVEIYQNCNIFNDGAFDILKQADTREDWMIRMEHGQPLRFGAGGSKAVVRGDDGALVIEDGVADDDPRVVVHDAHADDPSYAFALSRRVLVGQSVLADGRVSIGRTAHLRRDDGRAAPTRPQRRRRGTTPHSTRCSTAPTAGRSRSDASARARDRRAAFGIDEID